MSDLRFDDVFHAATGLRSPYAYQCRLACGDDVDPDDPKTLRSGSMCESKLINIPTGLGKTAAVVLAWLWNRVLIPDETHRHKWPRRLVYCLPMRTLVEQTRDNVIEWIVRLSFAVDAENPPVKAAMERLDESARRRLSKDEQELRRFEESFSSAREALIWLARHSPVILMGGGDKTDWDLHPERPAVLIGTQDMLLSRALNRGYGMSRYRWPMHFALLNNDCLWVLDETQLMGVSVETSAQLDGFRHLPTIGTLGSCPTWWMSATLDRTQLNTVDHPEPEGGWPSVALGSIDLALPFVRKRVGARKNLAAAPISLSLETKKDYAKRLSEFISNQHQTGTLSLVVLNRVARAQAVYSALRKSGVPKERLALIHSRFRSPERQRHTELLNATGDRIVIATQAVEAGVDVSARILITELAPWSSLVQRFGRCNRGGEFVEDAEVIWIDVDTSNEDFASPYSVEALNAAREGLKQADSDVGAASLGNIAVPALRVVRPVLRRKDLLDLFDTTPDLCGNDLDVSRYIRDGDDTDVQIFWRALPEGVLNEELPAPERHELCRVSLAEFTKFVAAKTRPQIFAWNALDEEWQEAKRPRPGVLYLVAAESGGYSNELGWTREAGDKPTDLHAGTEEPESNDANPETFLGRWLSIEDHTSDVVKTARDLTSAIALTKDEIAALEAAALWHDVGKAHPVFQQMLRNSGTPPNGETLWAKSATGRGGRARKGFRHELASALAWLIGAPGDSGERDLVAFLIAAHHGKVRLSIRALPNEDVPDEALDRLHARGVWDGEALPRIPLPGEVVGPIELDLSFMQMGIGPRGPSWFSRMLALRDRFGPIRLAYLEALLRVADMRASDLEVLQAKPCTH
jgi:CRISPR-associated endonuclease/helicase Cas3